MSEEQAEHPQETPSPPEPSPQELEKIEEAKLKAKYPSIPGGPGRVGGHSSFLQKRLAKGQKFFDSGDYQMAKQKMGGINKPPLKVPGPIFPTGDAIPTPETVPARKTSLVQPSKLATMPSATTPTSLGPNVV
ncbi:cAMP-regulated phosphoprotein 19 [Euwallacea fornicatus]|uniref:cAMP-regulated phosphoprotein 19 n=1 Tax=Euwallacea fornicatus TaxID=995702 RepID=UPI00338DEA04